MHKLTLLYILQRYKRKAPNYELSRSKTPKTQKWRVTNIDLERLHSIGYKHQSNFGGIFYGVKGGVYFSAAITLII